MLWVRKAQILHRGLDGGKVVHSSTGAVNSVSEITWSSNIRFTIRDASSGLMVIMGEAHPNTDYSSSGLRLRVPASVEPNQTGPKFGAFSKLSNGKEYHIVVEAYF